MSFVSLAISALLVGQTGPLEITNARPTVGPLGPPVPKDVREAGRLPGDVAWFSFDVKNAKTDSQGKTKISLSYEITDSKGLPVFKEGPVMGELVDFLGSGLFPGSMHLEMPLDSKPGIYDVKLTVTDLSTKKKRTAVFEAKGKVRAPEFGIVRVATFADPAGRVPSPAVGVVGQNLFIRFAAIHFKSEKGAAELEASLKVLDSNGKNVLALPMTKKLTAIPESPFAPGDFGITLNRVGEFTIEIDAHDKLGEKSAKFSFPLRVVAP